MGAHRNVTADRFPAQGSYFNRACKVCFHYDTTKWVFGKIVRDDSEPPHRTIIQLNDGRVVLATECQYQPIGGLLTNEEQPVEGNSTGQANHSGVPNS